MMKIVADISQRWIQSDTLHVKDSFSSKLGKQDRLYERMIGTGSLVTKTRARFVFHITTYFKGEWKGIFLIFNPQLAQATEMLYMRLDTMSTTCVDRYSHWLLLY